MKIEIKKEWSTYSLQDRYFIYLDDSPVKVYDSFEEAKENLENIKINALNSKPTEVLWTEVF